MENLKTSKTMKVTTKTKISPHYLVIKIGDKFYSTTFGKMGVDFKNSEIQISDTKNIGSENNLYVTGVFTETNSHARLPEKLPFELNFYSDIKDFNNKSKFDHKEWAKSICERCGKGHLYCEKCGKYTWNKEDGKE